MQRKSQAMPGMDPMAAMGGGMPPGMPPMGGGMPPGMPPMGGAMPGMGMPAAPMAAPAGPPPRQAITGPLNTLAKILYDADVESQIDNATASDPDKITLDVWQQYGGDMKGGADQGKVGTRVDSPDDVDPTQNMSKSTGEQKTTDKTRWQRLPQGKMITDITSLDDMGKVIHGLLGGQVAQMAKANAAPPGGAPGGAGGPPAMAHRINMLLRFAQALDDQDCPEQAEIIEYSLLKINF